MTPLRPTASTILFTLAILLFALTPSAWADTTKSAPPEAPSEETIADPETGASEDSATARFDSDVPIVDLDDVLQIQAPLV